MRIELWLIGKTTESYLQKGCDVYEKRLKHYIRFDVHTIKNINVKSAEELKQKEGEAVLDKLENSDVFVLLDEKGKQFGSEQFSEQLQIWMNQSTRRIIFLIAGAFGASEALKQRADLVLSLSKMTFSHQMIRMFFLEQLYRSFTILKNEKYHNP